MPINTMPLRTSPAYGARRVNYPAVRLCGDGYLSSPQVGLTGQTVFASSFIDSKIVKAAGYNQLMLVSAASLNGGAGLSAELFPCEPDTGATLGPVFFFDGSILDGFTAIHYGARAVAGSDQGVLDTFFIRIQNNDPAIDANYSGKLHCAMVR